MSKVIAHITVSADGYSAGPNQSLADPLGERGEELHTWMFEHEEGSADAEAVKALADGYGAFVMGRNMFGSGRGAWDLEWTGWWGDNPPYHAPVFVLTNHPRESVTMAGGTTFHFVTDGIESALKQAHAAAGDMTVGVAGGAQTVQQYIRAGLLDELHLHISPVVLGAGERLLDDIGTPAFAQIKSTSGMATHISYRVTY
ncbi:dihydrofolate reductase family protein [Actinocrispum wychmicini]|uniref:RibD domain-containing protein n=1 Tax=Actinocrispum wychmicini TaxID=1213861 RepID=A0A4V2S5W2_9PSEU|nr:dihydrofolate reductase family protein [Actinocrispum wychmicini]TCO53750.1 RibD domain-containing protein [Actinocrispum wychmicini]